MTVMGKIQADAKQKLPMLLPILLPRFRNQQGRVEVGQGAARRRGVKPVTSIFQISHNETDINYTYLKFIF